MPEENFPFDRTIRELLQSIPRRFTELLTGKRIIEVLDPTFPSVSERIADFIARLEDGRIVHVELQLQHDPSLQERMIEYFLRIKQRHNEIPLQLILWLGEGKPPYREKVEIGPLTYKCTIKDIKEINCKSLLESDDPNDNLLAVLCKRKKGFWETLTERLMRLPEDRRKAYIQKLAYLVKLRRDITLEYETLRKEVTRMPIVIDLEKDPSYIKGMEKGLIIEAQELVIEALEERFGSVSEEVKNRIKTIQDRAFLKTLHRFAINVKSLEEFISRLNNH
jgi:hypothetical protein